MLNKHRFVPHIAPKQFKLIFCGTIIGPGWHYFSGGQRQMLRDATVQYYQKLQSSPDDGEVRVDVSGLFDTTILTQHMTYHYQLGSKYVKRYSQPGRDGTYPSPPLLYLDQTLLTVNGIPTNEN